MRGDEFATIGRDPETSGALALAAIEAAEPPLDVRGFRGLGH